MTYIAVSIAQLHRISTETLIAVGISVESENIRLCACVTSSVRLISSLSGQMGLSARTSPDARRSANRTVSISGRHPWRGVAAAAAARRGAGSLFWSSTAAFDSTTSRSLTDVQMVAISNIQTSIFRGGR